MNKPRLTKRVARGLDSVVAFLSVQIDGADDSDLFCGVNTAAERKEIEDAVAFIVALRDWKDQRP